MGFENRLPPEGINVGKTNILAELIWLLGGFAAIIVALVVALYLLGGYAASYIPFSYEERLSGSALSTPHDAQSVQLQRLADKLAKGAELPPGVRFHVKYIDDGEVNAYATLGGVIMLHRGLLERLHSENAVALVLAHEMSHVIHRDPAMASGGQLLVSASLRLLGSVVGMDDLGGMASTTGGLALLSFSRSAERNADALGIELVGHHYGHLAGVGEVFTELAAYESDHGLSVPEFLNNHPETAGRKAALADEAKRLNISMTGPLTPLPASLRSAK